MTPDLSRYSLSNYSKLHRQQVRELLTAARDLLTDPAKWTKGKWARAAVEDPEKCSPLPNEPEAVCFCSAGALWCVLGKDTTSCSLFLDSPHNPANASIGFLAACALEAALPGDFNRAGHDTRHPVIAYNDAEATTHADVLSLFDRAIASIPS